MGGDVHIVSTDNSPYAPALYLADSSYLVPLVADPGYIPSVLDICARERIQAVTTFFDPEIEILARHREEFERIGVEVLAPYAETASLCFDKFKMFNYLRSHGIATVDTYGSIEDFKTAVSEGVIGFPVFVKPRTGSGSVGAEKVADMRSLESLVASDGSLIIQEFMDCLDLDADVYIDTISHQAVSAFSKRKLETKIGGASKTVSFKDPKLFEFIKNVVANFRFNGPVDMDFFYRDGQYYLSEVNPRFGGAYLHAYGAGVDFFKLIDNNLRGIANEPVFGDYDEGVVMMMYDSVVIQKIDELVGISNGGGAQFHVAQGISPEFRLEEAA